MSGAQRAEVEAAVLSANERFYAAFSAGDHAAMAELWAAEACVLCMHPGLPPLVGRAAVLDSWRQILREPPTIRLRCDEPVVNVLGESAIVTCYEAGGEHAAHLVATNVFVREGGRWRMVHHQAGPLSVPIRRAASRSRLN